MEGVVKILFALAPVAWTAAAAGYFGVFLRDDPGTARWARRLLVAAILVHLGVFAARAAAGFQPIASGALVASGMGLFCGIVYLWLERRIARGSAGVFAAGSAALLVVGSHALGDPLAVPGKAFPQGGGAVHIIVAAAGYAGLLLAAVFGGLLLAQRRALRKRTFGLFWERVPSLELLDAFTAGSLLAAAVFLTGTIGLGHMLRRAAESPGPYADPKIVVTNVLWALTLSVALLRRYRRIGAGGAAASAIALFALALANLVVVNRISPLHGDV
ncbi:MAG: hypothetical protein HMLKMBBP_01817 [Planctomycetes bacterium]|nr:hypothetical protein [Planctomycetota bacterium]